jgi:VanZ family protein
MEQSAKHYRPAIVWALFILLMCSIKLDGIASSPIFFPGFDKLVHCGFFFVLVILWCYGLIRNRSGRTLLFIPLLLIIFFSVVYGGAIELLQNYLFTWRSGEWGDLFADTVGATMGGFSVLITFNATRYAKK